MEEVGVAIKEIINYFTIRGKFSAVHHDLAAEGITRVEVGEEGFHFITNTNEPGELSDKTWYNRARKPLKLCQLHTNCFRGGGSGSTL